MRFTGLVIGCLAAYVQGKSCRQYSKEIETPCNKVVAVKDGYEVRRYAGNQTEFFTDAQVDTTCYVKATMEGFKKNFKYISGANSRNETIPMTAPVIARPDAKAGAWRIGFFVPSAYEAQADVPTPDDPSIHIVPVPKGTLFAVKTFGGFASASDFKVATFDLMSELSRDGLQPVGDEWSIVWATYDSPFVLFRRHNEVWVHVKRGKAITEEDAEDSLDAADVADEASADVHFAISNFLAAQ